MSCRSGVSDRRGSVYEVEGEIRAVVAVVFGDELYFFGLGESYVDTLDDSVSLHVRVCVTNPTPTRGSLLDLRYTMQHRVVPAQRLVW